MLLTVEMLLDKLPTMFTPLTNENCLGSALDIALQVLVRRPLCFVIISDFFVSDPSVARF